MSADWMPLFVAALGLVGAAGTYAYQRRVDRQTALLEMRRAAYRNYLSAFIAMSDSPERDEDIRRKYYQSEIDLLVVGSDEVAKRVGALSRFYSDTNDDRFSRDAKQVRHLVAEICRTMREDCFESSDLTIDEIQALVPIK